MLRHRAVITAITETAVDHGWPATLRLALLIGAVRVTTIPSTICGALLWMYAGK